jgi:hypothetical protein
MITPIWGVEEWVCPPAMAGLAALTALELVGATSLPPNWCQLSTLQRLQVTVSADFAPIENMQMRTIGILNGGLGR